jgi:hypothetical protein
VLYFEVWNIVQLYASVLCVTCRYGAVTVLVSVALIQLLRSGSENDGHR